MSSRGRRGSNKKGSLSCPICLQNFAASLYTSTNQSQQLQQENLLLEHMMKCSAVSVSTSTEPSILQPSPSVPPPYASPRNKKNDDDKAHGHGKSSPNLSVPSLLHLSDDSSSSHTTGETSISRVDSSSDDTYASSVAPIQAKKPNVHLRITKSKETSQSHADAALATSEFPGTVGSATANLSRPNMVRVRVENSMQDQEKAPEAEGVNKKHQTDSCNISDNCTKFEGCNRTGTGTSSRTFSPTSQGMSSFTSTSTPILEEERSDPRNTPSAARQDQMTNTTTKDVEHNTGLSHSPDAQALDRNSAACLNLKRKGNEDGVFEDNLNLSCMKTSTAPTTCTTSSVLPTTFKTGIRAGEKRSLDLNERPQLKRRSTRPTCTAECPICMRVFHTTTTSLTEINHHIMSCSDLQERMASRISKSQGKSREKTQSMAKSLPSNVCDKKVSRSTLAKQRASRAESVKSLRHGTAHRVIRHILLRDWDPSMSNEDEGSTNR